MKQSSSSQPSQFVLTCPGQMIQPAPARNSSSPPHPAAPGWPAARAAPTSPSEAACQTHSWHVAAPCASHLQRGVTVTSQPSCPGVCTALSCLVQPGPAQLADGLAHCCQSTSTAVLTIGEAWRYAGAKSTKRRLQACTASPHQTARAAGRSKYAGVHRGLHAGSQADRAQRQEPWQCTHPGRQQTADCHKDACATALTCLEGQRWPQATCTGMRRHGHNLGVTARPIAELLHTGRPTIIHSRLKAMCISSRSCVHLEAAAQSNPCYAAEAILCQ